MKKMLKIFSAMLSVLMLCSLLPLQAAHAEDEYAPVTVTVPLKHILDPGCSNSGNNASDPLRNCYDVGKIRKQGSRPFNDSKYYPNQIYFQYYLDFSAAELSKLTAATTTISAYKTSAGYPNSYVPHITGYTTGKVPSPVNLGSTGLEQDAANNNALKAFFESAGGYELTPITPAIYDVNNTTFTKENISEGTAVAFTYDLFGGNVVKFSPYSDLLLHFNVDSYPGNYSYLIKDYAEYGLKLTFNAAAAYEALNGSISDEEALKILEQYKSVFDISALSALSEAGKLGVIKTVRNNKPAGGYQSAAEVKSAFDSAIAQMPVIRAKFVMNDRFTPAEYKGVQYTYLNRIYQRLSGSYMYYIINQDELSPDGEFYTFRPGSTAGLKAASLKMNVSVDSANDASNTLTLAAYSTKELPNRPAVADLTGGYSVKESDLISSYRNFKDGMTNFSSAVSTNVKTNNAYTNKKLASLPIEIGTMESNKPYTVQVKANGTNLIVWYETEDLPYIEAEFYEADVLAGLNAALSDKVQLAEWIRLNAPLFGIDAASAYVQFMPDAYINNFADALYNGGARYESFADAKAAFASAWNNCPGRMGCEVTAMDGMGLGHVTNVQITYYGRLINLHRTIGMLASYDEQSKMVSAISFKLGDYEKGYIDPGSAYTKELKVALGNLAAKPQAIKAFLFDVGIKDLVHTDNTNKTTRSLKPVSLLSEFDSGAERKEEIFSYTKK